VKIVYSLSRTPTPFLPLPSSLPLYISTFAGPTNKKKTPLINGPDISGTVFLYIPKSSTPIPKFFMRDPHHSSLRKKSLLSCLSLYNSISHVIQLPFNGGTSRLRFATSLPACSLIILFIAHFVFEFLVFLSRTLILVCLNWGFFVTRVCFIPTSD
jgi:hypothetical protein